MRNAWDGLMTAKDNAQFLGNQADIAAEFLELARKERQLGNRSLLDVLTGETALINANSDAVSAQTDVALGTYTLLSAMGRLTPAAIRELCLSTIKDVDDEYKILRQLLDHQDNAKTEIISLLRSDDALFGTA